MPPLVAGVGGLVCESVGKTDLLSRESVELSPICHLSPCLTTIAPLSRLVPLWRHRRIWYFSSFSRTGDVISPVLVYSVSADCSSG